MARGTGVGTENLWRGVIHAQANSATTLNFTAEDVTAVADVTDEVAANHYATVLNIIFCEQGGRTDCTLDMYLEPDGTTTDIYLLKTQPLPAYSTFTWNEKLVLHPQDAIVINSTSSANVDIYHSYILTNWGS